MKRFITGPTGAGKTTTAKRMAKEGTMRYIACDEEYAPALVYPQVGLDKLDPEVCLSFLESLPSDCVVDNVPYDPTWETFNAWAKGRTDVQVFCKVLPKDEWMPRKTGGKHPLTSKIWNRFWIEVFPTLGTPVSYINGYVDEIPHRKAMEMIGFADIISERLKNAPKTHDIKYQDIPEIGLKGYSGSAASWEAIKGLADWENSSVVDCGTFHGYMLFRISDAGCKKEMIGLDFLDAALETSRAINRLRGDRVEFRKWDAGDPLPEVDVTLCLNALHHFPDERYPIAVHSPVKCSVKRFFDSVKSPVVILETYTSFEEEIRSYWPSVESFPSSRPGRMIYRCSQ